MFEFEPDSFPSGGIPMTVGRRSTRPGSTRLRSSLPEVQEILAQIQSLSLDLERTVEHAESCAEAPDPAYMCDLEDEISRLENELAAQIARLAELGGSTLPVRSPYRVLSDTHRL